MAKRDIVKIDEDRCNGCGLCVPGCPEGALQIIDGKARLVSDIFCDGLGACIGECPQGAITVEKREAEPYDERKAMQNIVKMGANTIRAHLTHLKEHGETKLLREAQEFLKEKGISIEAEERLPCGCPGTALRSAGHRKDIGAKALAGKPGAAESSSSELKQWPVQLRLLPVKAQIFDGAHLLVAADCVPFADADFHPRILSGKTVVIGCPKLDDISSYEEKLAEIFRQNDIKEATVAIMEVPCCSGLHRAVTNAIEASGKMIPLNKEVVRIPV